MNTEAKALEKHLDPRGLLIEVLKANEIVENIQHIYFSTSKPGAVRGNHYHKRKVEWFCVVKGTSKILIVNNNTGEEKELIMSGENPSIVKIVPGFSHAIKNIGSDDMHLIVVANEVFNPNDTDTYPANLVVK